jgi:glycerophosphoryl diester phosphodiesterase
MNRYQPDAQIYDSQFVIRNSTTVTSSSSGGLIVEGGVTSRDTYVVGDVAVNDVRITPNLGDIVKEQEARLGATQNGWATVTREDETPIRFDNSYTSSVKSTVWVSTDEAKSVWEINAVFEPSGSNWVYNTSFRGDMIEDLDFRIINDNSFGTLQYTSPVAIDIRVRATTSAPYGVKPEQNTHLVTDLARNFSPDSLIYADSTQTFTYSTGLTYSDDTLNATKVCTGSMVVDGGVTIGGHLMPSVTETFDIGSEELRWKTVFCAASTIDLGGVQISAEGGSVSLGESGITLADINATGTSHTLGTVFVSGGDVSAGSLRATAVSAGSLTFSTATGGSVSASALVGATVSAGTLAVSNMTGGSFYANSISTGSLYVDGKQIIGGTHTLENLSGFLYIAHRGQPQRAPQQTAIAYKDLLSKGYKELEFDLRMSTDGTLFLLHGDDLATYTNGTGNLSSSTSAYAKSLFVKGIGSTFGDQPVMTFVEFLQFIKDDKCTLFIEGKVAGAIPKMMNVMNAFEIDKKRIAIADFDPTRLSLAKDNGFRIVPQFGAASTSGEANTIITTCQSINADYITVSYASSNTGLTTLVNSGIPVLAYTVQRRFQRDRLVSLGCAGLYSDDIEYTSSDSPYATRDAFDLQQWMPGMLALGDSTAESARGKFIDNNWWGWATRASAQSNFVLQGWACPIKNNLSANDYVIEYSLMYTDASEVRRWGGIFVHDSSMVDQEVFDSGSSPANEKGYTIFQRIDGEFTMFYRSGTSATNLGTVAGTALSYNVEYHYRLTITPTSVTYSRLNASRGTVVSGQTLSVNNTQARGGYFSLGVNTSAARFRNIYIS